MLRRSTGFIVAAAVILVTAAITTLVNQAFFAPADSTAVVHSQVESTPDSGQTNFNPGAAEEPPGPAEIESGAPAPATGLSGAGDSAAESRESEVGSKAAEEIESDAVDPGPDPGEAELAVEAANAGHSHSPNPESPEPAPKICVVANGDPQKLYWRFVEFHAARAADIVGMHLIYSTHPDIQARVKAIEACARNGAHMILATLADPQVIVPALRAAAEQGVRIASFGPGAERADDAGSLIHVSMDGSAAARRAADQFNSAGISGSVLCLVPDGVE